MFKRVDPKQNFPKMEEEILNFWEENKIFEKSVEKNSEDKPFIFYEGPPTANGKPGLHHVLARSFKDIIPRYKTMKGYRVERKAGWDTHGLPVELQVEKALGLKNKQDIENIVPGDARQSIIEFNQKCKESVWEYKDLWEKLTRRMAYWVDMDNPYITYKNEYIESVWWVISQIAKTKNEKGESLIYKGHKVVPYCYRCGTALSSHEVAQGYQVVKDNSIIAKFKINYKPGKTGRGVGVIVKNEKGEILLAKRNEKGRRVTWALSGGKVDQGEDFQEAVRREVKEELGVDVKSAHPFSGQVDIFEGRLFETIGYEVEIEGEPKNMVPEEIAEIKWFDLNDLPEVDYPPSRRIIDIYKSKKEEFVINDDITRPLSQVYFLVWTTTPWTLPGNVALAIGTDINYSMVKYDNNFYILAKDLLEKVFEGVAYEFIRDIEAKELIGLEYQPLFSTNNTDKKAYYVISGDFVTTQDGTGIVHIAPAFGEDDNRVGKENDLPTLITVDLDGKVTAPVPGEGIAVKKKNEKNKYAVDDLIIEDLKNRDLLFKEDLYEHDYPFCWRCDTPLIYYAKPSWFIRMNELAGDLVKNNEVINWVPEHIKDGRFGEWLRGVKDWAISRERYWGTPLPIWQCEKCGETKVVESMKELEELSGKKLEDIHKPYVDEVTFQCDKCDARMVRTPEVMDVWFDSGSMPLAQWHYPSSASEDEKKKIESGQFFPADYICEAIDQTRGWFYTLHAIATLLHKSGKVSTGYAFKNVICLGHILDAHGKKMSKSRGNVIDPVSVMNEYGADMLRWMLFTINQPGLPKRFDIKGMRDIMNRVFRMLWNSYYFFVMYANIDNFRVTQNVKRETKEKINLLDKWIISEMQGLIKHVDSRLENYDAYNSAKAIELFIDNLSNWYIRRSRKRFWKSENDGDKNEAYETLHYVLVTLSKLMAPFTPFVSEEIYRNLIQPSTSPLAPLLSKERGAEEKDSPTEGEKSQNSLLLDKEKVPSHSDGEADEVMSVHLADFPVAEESLIDEKLNDEMARVRNIISLGLQLRAQAKVKVRQPLKVASIKYNVSSMDLMNIIQEELNVKEVKIDENQQEDIKLDTEITEDLKLEGVAREIIRHIQEMRKEAGYEVDNRIQVCYTTESSVFDKFGELISKEVLADKLQQGQLDTSDLQKEFTIEGQKVLIAIKR